MANEKRLIDAEQAKRATYEEVFWTESEQAVVRNFLAKLPKVDAVEVVHGGCDWCNGDYHTKIMATAIRYHSNGNMDGYEMKVKYCPNCGAKMDGDGNGKM